MLRRELVEVFPKIIIGRCKIIGKVSTYEKFSIHHSDTSIEIVLNNITEHAACDQFL